MNKKIKRIGKTVLTFALVLTMLFGQLPSGLVLNSLAAPEETSEPSSENPGKGKDYSAGVSSIVDAPQDTSEEASEEDYEDESESEPETVSDDSNLTSEVNADSETVIKEETNSDSAQDENNQDDNKQDDNKEESSASEEAEVVSENPSEQISAEVPSEKEEISETPSENTSDENKPEIKDGSGEKKSIISGIVEPFRNFGFIFFDIDFEGFEEMLGEPNPEETIKVKVVFAESKEIKSGESISIDKDTTFTLKNTSDDSDLDDEAKVTVKYKGEEPKVAVIDDANIPGKNKSIINFTIDDFALEGEDKDKYEIDSIELSCDVKPVPTNNILDISGNNTYCELTNSVGITFNEGKRNSAGIIWYGPEVNEGKIDCNEPGGIEFFSYNSEEYSVTSIGDYFISGNEIKDVVVKKDDIYYGPFEIKYNYDNYKPVYDISTFNYSTATKIEKNDIKNNTSDTEPVEPGEPAKEGSGFNENSIKIGKLSPEDVVTEENVRVKSASWGDRTDFDKDDPYDYYYYIEDYAGNYNWGKFDSSVINDHDKPEITLTVEEGEGGTAVSAHAPILSTFKFSIKATDKEGGSGLTSVKVHLFDGLGNLSMLYESAKKDFAINQDHTFEWNSGVLDYSDYFGYQLHFVFEVADGRTENTRYYYAFYKNGSMNLTEADSYNAAKEACNSIDKTYAVLGTGDNAPKIVISSTDEPLTDDEDHNVYYVNSRKVSVQFEKMALDQASFYVDDDNEKPTGSGVIKDFEAESGDTYDENNHMYKYSNGELNFSYNENNASKLFSISRDKPGDPEETVLDSIIGFDIEPKNSSFRLDKEDNIKVEIVISRDNSAKRGDDYYYYGDVKGTITISGDSLPEMKRYSEQNCLALVGDLSQNDLTWEQVTANKKYVASFTLTAQDDSNKKYSIQAKATKNAYGWNPEYKDSNTELFIIDTIAPTFDISYSGETNSVVILEESRADYYYGLENGTEEDQPHNVAAKVTFTEANIFKDDITIEVSKNGGSFEELYYNPDTEKTNPYGISVDMSKVNENQPDNTQNESEIEIMIPGLADHSNDGEYILSVSYTDPATHKMVKAESSTIKINVDEEGNGTGQYIGNEHNNIIDTKRPEATFIITDATLDGGKVGRHYSGDGDYYNFNFRGQFAVAEDHFEKDYLDVVISNSKEIIPDGATKTIIVTKDKMTYNSQTFSYVIPSKDLKDGDYFFGIKGKDLANNVLVIKAGNGATDNDFEAVDPEDPQKGWKDCKLDNAETWFVSGKKVYDITNPIVDLAFNSYGATNKERRETFKRFFFNDKFTATFTVEETNFSNAIEDLTVNYGEDATAGDYTYGDVSVDKSKNIEINGSEGIYKAEKTFENEGLYILSLSGIDKAGNPVKIKEGINTALDDQAGKVTSYIVAIDKTAPTLEVSMKLAGKENNFFKSTLSQEIINGGKQTKYVINDVNLPYQKENTAIVSINETTDKSWTSLAYSISSSIKGKEKETTGTPFSRRTSVSETMEGPMIYWINSLSIEDLAGNKISLDDENVKTLPRNKIYLDTTFPSNDQLAPQVRYSAKASGAGRGPEGQELYDKTVVIKAFVEDNKGEGTAKIDEKDYRVTASGLYKIYYEVIVNGNDLTDKVSVDSEKSGTGGRDGDIGRYITYGTSGPGFNNLEPKADESLTYSDTLTFTIPANGDFNYNNISLKVWAQDNAGNIIQKGNAASYSFGIDITNPSISVSYSNNNAQNGKYFKDPRTATVRVSERNFDASRTSISTQSAAHISGWSYSRGNSDNGDDDTWTAYVTYDTDGDYTLGVSATDLLGHGASGVSWNDSVAPTEFTIDLTKPTINVSFDNNRVSNGRYYNANRRATIDINEHNFDTKDVTVERTASIAEGHVNVPGVGNWSRINDVNRTDVYFGQDGDYTMKVDYVDLAGNVAETYVVDTFTIDTVAPDLEIGGVEDKHAYNAKVAPSITYHDINYDKNSANISITGYNHPRGNNLDGVRSDERFGGSFICNNIDEVRDNDDIYTAKATISDLAGNTTEKEVTFSVNRFGSNYILSDSTKAYVDKYYNQDGEDLEITEINVNELSSYSVSYTKDGNLYNLAEDVEYSVEKSNPGWWQYDYHISDVKNFGDDSTNEGTYVVTLSSIDGASNKNSNRAVQETKTETNELPIEFIIDHTAPQVVFTGVEDNGKYRANERTIMIRYEDKSSFVDSLKIFNGDKLVEEYDAKQLSEKGGEIQFNAGASNNWQELKVEVTDAAGNMSPYESGRFLLTSNVLAQYLHSLPLVLATIGGVVLLIGVIIVILILRRRKRY